MGRRVSLAVIAAAYVVALAVAVAWGIDARRRMRFRREIAAPGVVELIEGAIRYYGARALGGEIALRDLVEVRLLTLRGHPHWRLRSDAGEALLIPVEAAGAAARKVGRPAGATAAEVATRRLSTVDMTAESTAAMIRPAMTGGKSSAASV